MDNIWHSKSHPCYPPEDAPYIWVPIWSRAINSSFFEKKPIDFWNLISFCSIFFSNVWAQIFRGTLSGSNSLISGVFLRSELISEEVSTPTSEFGRKYNRIELFLRKKLETDFFCYNFFVFQSYKLRFSGEICRFLIRSFPGSFLCPDSSQDVVSTSTSDLG